MIVREAGLIFQIEYDNVANLIKVDSVTGDELIIPAYVNGLQVKKIGKRAFFGNANLVNIGIPASVTFIDEEAFALCRALRSVKFYTTSVVSSFCELGQKAFKDCYCLESIYFPNKIILKGGSVFENCWKLCDIKGKFNSLLSLTFAECHSLKELVFFGKSFISYSAFKNCKSLYKLTFTGTLSEKISQYTLQYLQQLRIACYPDSEFVDWVYIGVNVEIISPPNESPLP